MKKRSLTVALLALAAVTPACGGGTPHGDPGGNESATLEASVDLDSYQECSVDLPCPEGLSCMVLDLVDGHTTPLCIDADEACDLVDCGGAECVVLESYPAQVTCSGTCEGDHCDDPVSSCDDSPDC